MESREGRRKRGMASHLPALQLAFAVFPCLLLVSACGLAPARDAQAFNNCLTRNPQDAPLCEAPRQAYDLALPNVAAASGPGLGMR